jgi:hypothetical protein
MMGAAARFAKVRQEKARLRRPLATAAPGVCH